MKAQHRYDLGAGLALTVYPGVMSVAGVMLLLRGRSASLQRTLLLGCACLFWLLPAIADVVLGRVSSTTWSDAGELAVFLLAGYGGTGLGRSLGARRKVGVGLSFGIGVVAVASIIYWLASPGRIAAWTVHPNIFGASLLLPACAAWLLSGPGLLRVVTLVIAFVPVGFSGSRSALLVLTCVAIGLLVAGLAKRWARSRARIVAAALMLVVSVTGVALVSVLQPRLAALVGDVLAIPFSALVPGALGVPQELGVKSSELGGGVVVVEAMDSNWWSRLQYPLVLLPGRVYTFSLEMDLQNSGESVGIYGAINARDTVTVSRKLGWEAKTGGSLALVGYSLREVDGGYTKIELSVKSGSDTKEWLWIGPAPDLDGTGAGEQVVVRSVVAWEGSGTSRSSTSTSQQLVSPSTDQAVARLQAFLGAWHGFIKSPLLGQRGVDFERYFRAEAPTGATAIPKHAHNAFLQSLFERGMVGTAGFLLLLVWVGMGLCHCDSQGGLGALLWISIAANMVDAVIWSAGMMYFLAAMGGMASGIPRRGETSDGR